MGIAKVIVKSAICALLLAGLPACQEDNQIGDDCDPAKSTCTPVASTLEKEIKNVDILFVIDKSQSMIQEQAKLAEEIPKLIKTLVTGDRNGDGKVDPGLKPAESIHLGVVTSDLGLPAITNRAELPDISCQGMGDDGRLQHQSHPIIDPPSVDSRCQAEYPTTFITHTTGKDDPDKTALDFGCMVRVGTYGCGFEQPLEAALKALWPSDNHDLAFLGDTQGHGGPAGENKGFLRDDSLLAIVVVTDEDDCSMGALGNMDILKKTPEGLTPEQVRNLNLRCYYDGKLPESERDTYPIKRYLDGFRALRPKTKDRVIFGVIGGIPPRLVDKSSDLPEAILGNIEADSADMADIIGYYQAILDEPDMQAKEDPASPGYLASACVIDNPDYDASATEGKASDQFVTNAQPARRFVELAQSFGVNGVVQSICEESFVTPIDRLTLALSNRIKASSAK
jgi:hypothetical protein